MYYDIVLTTKKGKFLFKDRMYTMDALAVCWTAAMAAVIFNGYKLEDYDCSSFRFYLYEKCRVNRAYKYLFDKVMITITWGWD